jgi:nondiscriminating glutamyl-tRNA synthetase
MSSNEENQNQIRVRFAPSPTGHLHIGGARTALFNWLYARKQGGSFILRFEDTDQSRNVEHAEEKLLRSLAWLGIDWDEGVDVGGPFAPYRQTERLGQYQTYVAQLLSTGDAYYCYCTEQQLEADRATQMASGETPKYVGRCRNLSDEQKTTYMNEGRKPVLRFRVTEGKTVIIDDAVRGTVTFETDGIGDFIIARPDGIPMYNFAVVLDDYLMGITHVLRGEEHLSNTPRQVLIYQALGWQTPKFAHISLILNQNRQKMSKRDESIIQFVEQYRELGYLPEAILNFLSLMGWAPEGEQEIFSSLELIEQFSLDRIAKNPAVFDIQKLNWMSNDYIKKATPERVLQLAYPHLQTRNWYDANVSFEALDESQRQWLIQLVELYQEQLQCAADLPTLVTTFFEDQVEIDGEAMSIMAEASVPQVLHTFAEGVYSSETLTAETVGALLKQVQASTGCKGKALFMPVRIALTGQMHGRDLNKTIALLGKEKVLQRLATYKSAQV